MSDIAPIQSPRTSAYHTPVSVEVPRPDPAAGGRQAEGQQRHDEIARPSDRVDISERARLLGKLAALPSVRQDLVDHIRAQIEAGKYDTPERFDAALEQLLDELA